jgi:hypothetical protein
MSTEIKLPEGAPEEVVTHAFVRDVDLTAFGGAGKMALITLDNGHDHNRPNTFGPASLISLKDAIPESHLFSPLALTYRPYLLFKTVINLLP